MGHQHREDHYKYTACSCMTLGNIGITCSVDKGCRSQDNSLSGHTERHTFHLVNILVNILINILVNMLLVAKHTSQQPTYLCLSIF